MKLLCSAFGIASLFSSSVAQSAPFQEDARQQQVYRGVTLKSRAAEAKAQGKNELTIGVPSDIPQHVPTLDHALANYPGYSWDSHCDANRSRIWS
jgi:hypothetical protein